MRNQPSEQSRDGRCPQREYRYVSNQASQESKNSCRSNRRINTKTDSYFEYVPSMQSSNQAHFNQGSTYKKPSLPYYVVPVLYVPQKVLSSEEIRPATAPLQNKRTVSFLVKNSGQSNKPLDPLDVDKIPCIPCETLKKLGLKSENYDSEEMFINNVDLDQPYTGYINASYTPSSTSAIEIDNCPNIVGNCAPRKSSIPTYCRYNDRPYPSKDCTPRGYHHFIEQRRRCPGSQNKVEFDDAVKADVRLRWNPEYRCYEKIESPSNTSKKSSESCEGSRKVRIKTNQECGTKFDEYETPCVKKQVTETQTKKTCSEDELEEYQCKAYELPCQKKQVSNLQCKQTCTDENIEKNIEPEVYQNLQCGMCKSIHEEYGVCEGYSTYCPPDEQEYVCNMEEIENQTSFLTCEKQPQLVGQIASIVGPSLVGAPTGCHQRHPRKKSRRRPPDTLTTETFLDDADVLEVSRKDTNRRPKESQTNFEDVMIYSTYVATDDTIRDSKSTQTLDPAVASVTIGTQTDRVCRTFETCPPAYMDEERDDVCFGIKTRSREISPSPTRAKRTTSPTKQAFGDIRRCPVIKSVEVTQKSSLNQNIQSPPLRRCKRKKVRASWSPV